MHSQKGTCDKREFLYYNKIGNKSFCALKTIKIKCCAQINKRKIIDEKIKNTKGELKNHQMI